MLKKNKWDMAVRGNVDSFQQRNYLAPNSVLWGYQESSFSVLFRSFYPIFLPLRLRNTVREKGGRGRADLYDKFGHRPIPHLAFYGISASGSVINLETVKIHQDYFIFYFLYRGVLKVNGEREKCNEGIKL